MYTILYHPQPKPWFIDAAFLAVMPYTHRANARVLPYLAELPLSPFDVPRLYIASAILTETGYRIAAGKKGRLSVIRSGCSLPIYHQQHE